jgi:hypothetical protein
VPIWFVACLLSYQWPVSWSGSVWVGLFFFYSPPFGFPLLSVFCSLRFRSVELFSIYLESNRRVNEPCRHTAPFMHLHRELASYTIHNIRYVPCTSLNTCKPMYSCFLHVSLYRARSTHQHVPQHISLHQVQSLDFALLLQLSGHPLHHVIIHFKPTPASWHSGLCVIAQREARTVRCKEDLGAVQS